MNFNPYRRRVFLRQGSSAVLALAGFGTGLGAQTQAGLPPLSVLCAGPAGSIPDIVARRVAEQLAGHSYARALVDNRPGAAGLIAVGALKAAPADGSVMLLAQGAIATVYPYLYDRLTYNPDTDIKPVSLAGEMTLALAVGPAVPATVRTVPELVAWFRANPKLANVGSPGTGTLPHLLESLLFRTAGVGWQHVVYAGGPPALVDLIGGQIAALVLPEGLLRQQGKAGRLRILATSGLHRSAYLPDVPSLVEEGYPDLVVREWFGFFMPGRVSAAVLGSSSQALRSALVQPALVTAFAELGMDAMSSSPPEMAARITAEQRYWRPLIRSQAIRAD